MNNGNKNNGRLSLREEIKLREQMKANNARSDADEGTEDEFAFMKKKHRQQPPPAEEPAARKAPERGVPVAPVGQKKHPEYSKPYKSDEVERRRRMQAAEKKRRTAQDEEKKKQARAEEIKRARIADRRRRERAEREKREELRQKRETEKKYRRERTEEENRICMLRREQRRQHRRAAAKVYFTRFIGSLLLASVLFAGSYAAFRYILSHTSSESHDSFVYVLGNNPQRRIPYSRLCRNGVIYLCGDDIASLCGLTVVGDTEEVKYISSGIGNETCSFIINTAQAFVNRNEIRTEAPTYIYEDRLYIPMSFFTDYAIGLDIIYDRGENKISVSRVLTNENDVKLLGHDPIYEDITYKVKNSSALTPVDENALSASTDNVSYKIDITPYEEYINPKSIFDYLQIISEKYPAEAGYAFDDLTQVSNQTKTIEEPIMLRLYAQKALEAMLLEARENGVTRYAVFRGYVTKRQLDDALGELIAEYDELTYEEAYTRAAEKLGVPEHDENLLGLSADVYFGEKVLSYKDSDVYAWFEENAHKFGFIIRYPENKTDSTGVSFRPWTLRFVGRYNATQMYKSGLTLEEYTEKYNLLR